MESRRDGGYGGPNDTQTGAGDDSAVALLVRGAGDPTSISADTRSMRVRLGAVSAPVPEQRTGHPARFGPGGSPDDLTGPEASARAESPSVRSRAQGTGGRAPVSGQGPVRPAHARRGSQLGLVVLPLRLILGGAFLVEGLRKLYDPGFLDPGDTDSFAHRISVLRPGSFFPPVMDLAAQHAIGTGLLFAFGQVIVGFGVVLGLWTRLMGLGGLLLSMGVLIAVGTASSPYHAPYLMFLAAFSPLALAGAPMYSADAWLSLRTWRGPVTMPVRARRRKLGYGSILACSGVGLTLLAGAMLGRQAPVADPQNQPGGPLPQPSAPALVHPGPGGAQPSGAADGAGVAPSPSAPGDATAVPSTRPSDVTPSGRGSAASSPEHGATSGRAAPRSQSPSRHDDTSGGDSTATPRDGRTSGGGTSAHGSSAGGGHTPSSGSGPSAPTTHGGGGQSGGSGGAIGRLLG